MESNVQGVHEIVKELQLDYKLNKEQALPIAIQLQRNQILEHSLLVSRTDNYPQPLEAIAMALGHTSDKLSDTYTVGYSADRIADSIDEIKEFINDQLKPFIESYENR